jgi:hypothetical protein
MAGTWSSAARLQALNPHSTFAVSPDVPKRSNPLLADANASHVHVAPAMDFTRTIPLSELMHADATSPVGRRRTQTPSASFARTMIGTMTNFGATTHNFTSSANLPLRVPSGDTYSHSLSTVHASRADRLIRQPKGWSQSEANRKKQQRQEEKEERIHIYQPTVHSELLQSAAQSRSSTAPAGILPPHRQRPAFIPSDPSGASLLGQLGATAEMAITAALDPETRAREREELARKKLKDFWNDVNEEKARVAAKLKERIARNAAAEELRFEKMMSRLNENQALLKEISEYLSLHTEQSEARKEALYRAWCAQIFGPISDAIASGLAQRSTTSIERRRRREFSEFLAMSNAKPKGLANDAILADEYDPLQGRRAYMKISVGHLHDPLKHAQEQEEEEWKIYKSFHPEAERIVHQNKEVLPLHQWAKYKIEATPHGRYSLLKGHVLAPVGKKMVHPSESYASEFTTGSSLDHYRIDTTQEAVKKQFWSHGGKRVEGYEAQAEQGRDYNILNANHPSIASLYSPERKHVARRAESGPPPAGITQAPQKPTFFPQQHPMSPAALPPITHHLSSTTAHQQQRPPARFIESKMEDEQ